MQHLNQTLDCRTSKQKTLVELAIQYIYKNIKSNISVYDIAEYLQVSRQYLHRIFKKQTGMTTSAFITHKKIEYAIVDIILGNEDIASAHLKYNFKSKHKLIEQIRHHPHIHSAK